MHTDFYDILTKVISKENRFYLFTTLLFIGLLYKHLLKKES